MLVRTCLSWAHFYPAYVGLGHSVKNRTGEGPNNLSVRRSDGPTGKPPVEPRFNRYIKVVYFLYNKVANDQMARAKCSQRTDPRSNPMPRQPFLWILRKKTGVWPDRAGLTSGLVQNRPVQPVQSGSNACLVFERNRTVETSGSGFSGWTVDPVRFFLLGFWGWGALMCQKLYFLSNRCLKIWPNKLPIYEYINVKLIFTR